MLAERARSTQRRSSPPLDLSAGSDWRTLRPPVGPSAAGRQFAWRHQPDPLNILDDPNEDLRVGFVNESPETSHSSGKRLHHDLEVRSRQTDKSDLFTCSCAHSTEGVYSSVIKELF